MRLKLLVSLAGPHYSLQGGEEHEFEDEAESIRLIEAGIAKPVSDKEYTAVLKRIDKAKAEEFEAKAEAERAEKQRLADEAVELARANLAAAEAIARGEEPPKAEPETPAAAPEPQADTPATGADGAVA